jgi:glutathione synthase/RimK-type ligase-like ATP-grasp enzyme
VERVILVTQTQDLAADLLVTALREIGGNFVRLNLDWFPQRMRISWPADGSTVLAVTQQSTINLGEFGAAWYRRLAPAPDLLDSGSDTARYAENQRLSFLRGLLETMRWRWMNSPTHVDQASLKLHQLRWANEAGFSVPDTIATNDPEVARSFVLAGPSVVKGVVGGSMREGQQRFAVFTEPIDESLLASDIAIQSSPIFVQRLVRNKTDVRVTVVGDQLFAVRILVNGGDPRVVDWRLVPPSRIMYEPVILPAKEAALCVEMLRAFKLTYGAFDLAETQDGQYWFLELNPSGQWGWIERGTRLPISQAIAQELASERQ